MHRQFIILSLFLLTGFISEAQKSKDGKYFFYDDFSNNHNDWSVSDNTDASQKVKDGVYELRHKRSISSWRFWKEIHLNTAYDFKVEARLKQVQGPDSLGYGIIWGSDGWNNSYNFTIASNGLFRIWGYKNKEFFVWKEWTSHKKVFGQGETNLLSIEKKGSRLDFFINGEKVHDHLFEPFFGSLFGFILGSSMEVEVDEYKIVHDQPEPNIVKGAEDHKKVNLGDAINSDLAEIAPIIAPDGKTLYIARRSPSSTGITGRTTCNVWVSTKEEDGNWSKLKMMPAPINNEGDNLVISVSADGNSLLLEGLYNSDGSYQSDLGISVSNRTREGWSTPKKVEIEDFYNKNEHESYCPTADQKVIVMSVERDDTYGKKDLYVSFRKEDGSYGKPVNVGPDLNTNLNEGTPFIAPDNKTLYFYSYGHAGYGSADIFVTKRLDDSWTKWSKPQNLGPEINGPGWDTYYSLSAKGDYAYLVSIEDSKHKADIFEIKLSEEAKPDPVVLISGKVLDKITNKPLEAAIIYESLEKGEKIGEAQSNPSNGSYNIILPYGSKYGFLAVAENYLAVNESIDLTEVEDYQEIKRDLYLVPIKIGQVIELQNVQFKKDRAELEETSYSELDRLVKLMQDNSKMEIELAGHTETRGNEKHLRELSEERVFTVRDYLVNKGIKKNRINGKGYGGSKPLGRGSEETEKRNRRVEMTITKI